MPSPSIPTPPFHHATPEALDDPIFWDESCAHQDKPEDSSTSQNHLNGKKDNASKDKTKAWSTQVPSTGTEKHYTAIGTATRRWSVSQMPDAYFFQAGFGEIVSFTARIQTLLLMFRGNQVGGLSHRATLVTIRATKDSLSIEGTSHRRDIMSTLVFTRGALSHYDYMDRRPAETVRIRLDPLLNVLRIHSDDKSGCKAKLAIRKPLDGPMELVIKEVKTLSSVRLHETASTGSFDPSAGETLNSTSMIETFLEQLNDMPTVPCLEFNPERLREVLANVVSCVQRGPGIEQNNLLEIAVYPFDRSNHVDSDTGLPHQSHVRFQFSAGNSMHIERIPLGNREAFIQTNIDMPPREDPDPSVADGFNQPHGVLRLNYPLRPWIAIGRALAGASRCRLRFSPLDGAAIIEIVYISPAGTPYHLRSVLPSRQ